MEATWTADSCRSSALTGARRAGAGDDRARRPVRRRRHRRRAPRSSRGTARRSAPGSRAASPRCSARGAPSDGDPAAFRAFVEAEFLPQGPALDAAFARLESAFERVDGYFNALGRDLRRGLDLAIGPELPIDARLGAWDPSSHVTDDLFSTRIAFVVLLNFPRSTLAERLRDGQQWSRRQWAETRLTGRVALRVPAAAQAKLADARAAAEAYINGYNLRAHHLLARDGRRLFRPKLRLISHWNLRDELKGAYADADGARLASASSPRRWTRSCGRRSRRP